MKLVTFVHPSGSGAAQVGVLRGLAGAEEVVPVTVAGSAGTQTLRGILAAGESSLKEVALAATQGDGLSLAEVRLRPPILDPQKIICIGLNYADHAAETGAKVGDEPVVFCKFPTALRGPDDPIELPPESQEVDYEAELVVVIGRTARRIAREEAWRYVAGYCCGHDVSARDWQKNKPGKQWLLGKSFDSFAPLGPWLVTADEATDPQRLAIELRLNGQVMQRSNTDQLIFGVDYLVSYLSHVCTLLPGDLIYTGTPPGVGMARTPPVFLQPGDQVEVTVEGLGTLRNPVVAASSGAP